MIVRYAIKATFTKHFIHKLQMSETHKKWISKIITNCSLFIPILSML